MNSPNEMLINYGEDKIMLQCCNSLHVGIDLKVQRREVKIEVRTLSKQKQKADLGTQKVLLI